MANLGYNFINIFGDFKYNPYFYPTLYIIIEKAITAYVKVSIVTPFFNSYDSIKFSDSLRSCLAADCFVQTSGYNMF